jgi:ribosomal protein S6
MPNCPAGFAWLQKSLLRPWPCVKVRGHMAEKEAKIDMETSDVEETSRVYEAGYHISPLIKEEDIEKIIAEIRGIVEKGKGAFIAEGAPVLMKLAYDIEGMDAGKKHVFDRGYFGWLKFESASETADALRDALTKHASIFRSMVFRTVREETRARLKAPQLREVKRTDTPKAPRKPEETSAPVSEVDIDKAIETLTLD